MTNSAVNVFYIGTHPILDTLQCANGLMEGANSILGHYDVGSDLVDHNLLVQHGPAVFDGQMPTNDDGSADANDPDAYCDDGFSNPPTHAESNPASWLHGGLIRPQAAAVSR